MKKTLVCLLVAFALLISCCAMAEDTVTVTVYDSDGVTVLNELDIVKGTAVTDLGIEKEGYVLQGIYVTPALLRQYNGAAIEEDTSLFVAWKSAKVDERPWMLAGSLTGYPDNAWGKAWPQDDYLLQKVENEVNTFAIELNLYEGDEFKIAVIGEGYAWSDVDSLDSRNVIRSEYLTGGEDAFNTGSNIKVLKDGLYRVTLVTDAETISLCKISVERLGEAAAAEYLFDLVIHGSFLDWDFANAIALKQNGSDYLWYGEFDAKEDGEFGIKNLGSDAWFSSADGSNVKVTAGHHMVFVELTPDNKLVNLTVGEPGYYVVGTCGNGGWGSDANAANTAYRLAQKDDGTYELKVAFTESETADWAGNKVAFKVVYGTEGKVANEHWFGTESGDNIVVDPGEYTINFDPATGKVTY